MVLEHDLVPRPRIALDVVSNEGRRGVVKSAACLRPHGSTVPVEPPQPQVELRVVVADGFPGALKNGGIGGVEAGQGGVEPDVGFSEAVAQQKRLAVAGQNAFQTVERREQLGQALVVDGLRRRKANFVDAIVDGGVDSVVEGANLGLLVFRVQAAARLVDLAALFR